MKKKKKKYVLSMMLLASVLAVHAQTAGDSLVVEQLDKAVVTAVRVQKNAPYAVANIEEKELNDFSKSGKELPFLFSRTPGILAWSENGAGTGTSYLRIRGAGDSRINVTIDGMPLNSPEDECVFWANMNSYSSFLGSVQIQRGVGSSTSGDGAFGGTVSLATKPLSYLPSVEVNASYGSFNTFNAGASFSTGLIHNHFIMEGAYHETDTDGYVHGTSGRSGSYYGALTWLGRNFILKYRNIGNFEHTGQAWNGVVAGNDDLSIMDGTYGTTTGIHSYADLYNAGLGRYNPLYEQLVTDADGNFVKDVEGKYQTARYNMNDGSLWPRTTDNFVQNHSILSAAWNISERWSTNLSMRYTYGYGYYEEFRPQNKLSKFGLSFTSADGTKVKRSDFVRRKGLDQDTYGLVYNLAYRDGRTEVLGGLSLQRFSGNHFGYLNYISNEELSASLLSDGDYKYYDSDARKDDYSGFVKATTRLWEHWNIFADLQYRYVTYRTDGINNKFIQFEDGTYINQRLDISEDYDFFNPKAGINFSSDGHRAYASVAISHREPERNNFTDNGSYPAPKAESLTDYELGYQYDGGSWHVGANLYYMDYRDQFVQTGQVSDIGEALTTNIAKSFRAGLELTADFDVTRWLNLSANAALSRNRILDFDEYAEDWDSESGYTVIHYDKSSLAFSPSTIANVFANLHFGDFSALWHSSYVSRQYLDNTANEDRSLPAYSLSGIDFGYTLHPRKFIKEVKFGLDLGNVFNGHYAANGWVYSAIYASGGHDNDKRYYQIGYIPMAGFTALGSVTLKF